MRLRHAKRSAGRPEVPESQVPHAARAVAGCLAAARRVCAEAEPPRRKRQKTQWQNCACASLQPCLSASIACGTALLAYLYSSASCLSA